jgi:hypothetical protein
MWIYTQSTGWLRREDGTHVATGYSGHGRGKNNTTLQSVRNVGPIPCGVYTIGEAMNHPKLGPIAIPLVQDPGNVMFGRDRFYAHGDNKKHDASLGCIILPRKAREEMHKTCKRLKVISNESIQS